MTLIASIEYQGAPVLVGDLLLTRPGPASIPRSTPLVLRPNSVIGDQASRSVSGMCQKVCVLHDHIVLAWAGSLLHAKGFAEYIRSFAAEKTATDYHELRSVVLAYPERDLEALEFILYSWHGAGFGCFSTLPEFPLGNFPKVCV